MSEYTKQAFYEMYLDLTDDERLENARRRTEREERIKEKQSDTGYDER